MSTKVLLGLIVLLAGILVGWFIINGNPVSKNTTQTIVEESSTPPITPFATITAAPLLPSGSTSSGQTIEKGGGNERVVVVYTDSGFSPSPLTIQKGETVTFTNESNRGMWVASDVYPTNQLLPGFDQLSTVPKAGIYEYTFVKVGMWKYHNQVNHTDEGIVIVK